jgi:peptidoglycan hydrolase CwlO-like protein
MKCISLLFSFFTRYFTAEKSLNHKQIHETIVRKEAEIHLLKAEIERLQQEIAYKDTHIQEITRSNTHLKEKISKILSDLSTSIHLN